MNTTSGPSPRSSQWMSVRSGRSRCGILRCLHRVARPDRAAAEDVGAQAAAACEPAHEAVAARELLQVVARLAQLHALALHFAHAETLPHERVQVDPAGDHL